MTAADERRTTYRRTEDIYRKAIEDIRDYAIFMTNAEGIVTEWNVGAEHILGYTAEEIIGKDAGKLFTLEDRGRLVPEKELQTAETAGRADDRELTRTAYEQLAKGEPIRSMENAVARSRGPHSGDCLNSLCRQTRSPAFVAGRLPNTSHEAH